MLIRASLNHGAHLAAGLVFGAMAAVLVAQLGARLNQMSASPKAQNEPDKEEQLS